MSSPPAGDKLEQLGEYAFCVDGRAMEDDFEIDETEKEGMVYIYCRNADNGQKIAPCSTAERLKNESTTFRAGMSLSANEKRYIDPVPGSNMFLVVGFILRSDVIQPVSGTQKSPKDQNRRGKGLLGTEMPTSPIPWDETGDTVLLVVAQVHASSDGLEYRRLYALLDPGQKTSLCIPYSVRTELVFFRKDFRLSVQGEKKKIMSSWRLTALRAAVEGEAESADRSEEEPRTVIEVNDEEGPELDIKDESTDDEIDLRHENKSATTVQSSTGRKRKAGPKPLRTSPKKTITTKESTITTAEKTTTMKETTEVTAEKTTVTKVTVEKFH